MQPKPGLDRRQIHQVRQALQHHLHTTEDSDAVVFIGRKIVAVPGELIFDKTLSGDEVRHWCALRTICNEGEINRLPDHNSLAEHFGKSHQTIGLYMRMLRATRWLSVIDVIRRNNLPTRYCYAIHDSQLSIEEVMHIDAGYLGFIFSEATGREKRLQNYCRQVLTSLERRMLGHFSPEQATLIYGMRAEKAPVVGKTDYGEPSVAGKTDNGESSVAGKTDNGESSVVGKTDYGESSAVGKTDYGEASVVGKIDNGEASVVGKTDYGEASVVGKTDNGESSVVGKTDYEEPSVVGKTDNGEPSVVGKTDNGEASVVGKTDNGEKTGGIYNRARVHPRAHTRARAPTRVVELNPTDLITHPSTKVGGCGGKDDKNPENTRFAFLYREPLSRLIPLLEAQYGKQSTHHLLNRLKALHYEHKGQHFHHETSEEDAAIVLISLLDGGVKAPLNFVDGLLYRASQGRLVYRDGQYQRYRQLTGQDAPSATPTAQKKPPSAVANIPDGTLLIGKDTGNRYRVTGNTIFPERKNADGLPEMYPDQEKDGLHAFRSQTLDECAHLIRDGHLLIVATETGAGE